MEIYKDLSNPASQEFEKLLNSQLSKVQIEEGKIIEGKINKITEKFVFLFVEGLKSSIEKTMPVNIRHVASLFWMELGEVDGKFPPSISQESREKYGRIFHHALKNGVYFAPSPFEVGFLSTVHQSEILTSVIDKMGGC